MEMSFADSLVSKLPNGFCLVNALYSRQGREAEVRIRDSYPKGTQLSLSHRTFLVKPRSCSATTATP